jgi:plasmid stabilization system protein ParE
MAFKVNWTRRAARDLAQIAAHIAADNSAAANREGGDILHQVDLIEQFPKIGSVYRRTPDAEYRSVLSGKYRIIYFIRPAEPVVDIITIRHGAQDEPSYL